MADADDQRIGQFVFEDVHQRQCGFVGEQDLQPAVGQDFFDRMAAYGVSDGIFTEQAGWDVPPVLRQFWVRRRQVLQ